MRSRRTATRPNWTSRPLSRRPRRHAGRRLLLQVIVRRRGRRMSGRRGRRAKSSCSRSLSECSPSGQGMPSGRRRGPRGACWPQVVGVWRAGGDGVCSSGVPGRCSRCGWPWECSRRCSAVTVAAGVDRQRCAGRRIFTEVWCAAARQLKRPASFPGVHRGARHEPEGGAQIELGVRRPAIAARITVGEPASGESPPELAPSRRRPQASCRRPLKFGRRRQRRWRRRRSRPCRACRACRCRRLSANRSRPAGVRSRHELAGQ